MYKVLVKTKEDKVYGEKDEEGFVSDRERGTDQGSLQLVFAYNIIAFRLDRSRDFGARLENMATWRLGGYYGCDGYMPSVFLRLSFISLD